MTKTLKEEAEEYEAARIKNVADLPSISITDLIQEENDAEFPYKYILVDGEKYKVANSVIAAIKDILEESPKVTKFKVKKKGEGMKTKYTTIPLN